MTLQYTEHPTPKIWPLVDDAPVEIHYIDSIPGIRHAYTPEGIYFTFNNKVLKNGDTFEIDDDKVSITIHDPCCGDLNLCDKACVGCNAPHKKIATLKLKEVDEDKILADGVKKMIKEAPIKSEYVLKGSERNKTIDDVLEILYCYLIPQTEVTKEIISEVKKLKH